MTEKLLTGTLSLNTTNQPTSISLVCLSEKSTEIFYSGMPPRVSVFHGRRTVLNIGGVGRGGANLSQSWFVAGHEGMPPCISKLMGDLAHLPPVPMPMFSHLPALYVTQGTIGHFQYTAYADVDIYVDT